MKPPAWADASVQALGDQEVSLPVLHYAGRTAAYITTNFLPYFLVKVFNIHILFGGETFRYKFSFTC